MVDAQVGRERLDPRRALRALPLDHLGRAAPEPVASRQEASAVGPGGRELGPVAALGRQGAQALPQALIQASKLTWTGSASRLPVRTSSKVLSEVVIITNSGIR